MNEYNIHGIQQATISIGTHPLSAKNTDKKKSIFTTTMSPPQANPASDLHFPNDKNAAAANYHSQSKIAAASGGSSFTMPA
jgi:hypothetical protein